MTERGLVPPLAVGVVGLVLGLVQAAIDPRRALFAYLAGVLAALTIALGALLFVMIANTARARWFVVLRRLASAIATTVPLFLVLFAPIVLGVRWLYPWAGALGDMDEAQRAWAAHARPWLNVPFFVGRSYAYLATWSAVAIVLRRTSIANDARPSEALVARERRVSAAGLPVMAFTLTFAAFDWVMPLSTRWSSDILGLYLFAGAFAGAMGATAVAAWLAWRSKILPSEVSPAHFHALGRVLLVSVIFWAYTAFSQFLLVWIADMDRETLFFAARAHGGWGWASAALFVCHFAAPLLLLLSRTVKRTPSLLALAGGWMVVAHALDVYWLIFPSLHAGMRWLDPAFLIGIGGLSTAFAAWRFRGTQPIPIHDPLLAESLRYESP